MNKKVYGVTMGVFAVLLLAGTFFDLQISQTLYNADNWFGIFFKAFGQAPSMLVLSFGFMLLVAVRNKSKKWISIPVLIICGALSLLYTLLPFSMAGYYMEAGIPVRVAIIGLGVAAFIAIIMGTKKIAEINDRKLLLRVSILLIVLYYVCDRLLGILKNIWGRPRFYSMLDDFSAFSPWYHIVGSPESDFFKSFPSGHAANAAMLVCIVLLARVVPKLKEKTALLYTIGFAWTGCTMLARIIAGAHFLSDVTVGAALTLTLFVIFSGILLRDTQEEKKALPKTKSEGCAGAEA